MVELVLETFWAVCQRSSHGLADRLLLRSLLVSCVIGRAGDFLHETSLRALHLGGKWRRSCRKRHHFSLRGDDKNEMRMCRSANPWVFPNSAQKVSSTSSTFRPRTHKRNWKCRKSAKSPPVYVTQTCVTSHNSQDHPAGKQNGPRFTGEKWILRGPRVGFATTSTVVKVPARAPPVVDHAARLSRCPRRTWTLRGGPPMDHHKVTYVDVATTPDVVLSWTLSRSKIEQWKIWKYFWSDLRDLTWHDSTFAISTI